MTKRCFWWGVIRPPQHCRLPQMLVNLHQVFHRRNHLEVWGGRLTRSWMIMMMMQQQISINNYVLPGSAVHHPPWIWWRNLSRLSVNHDVLPRKYRMKIHATRVIEISFIIMVVTLTVTATAVLIKMRCVFRERLWPIPHRPPRVVAIAAYWLRDAVSMLVGMKKMTLKKTITTTIWRTSMMYLMHVVTGVAKATIATITREVTILWISTIYANRSPLQMPWRPKNHALPHSDHYFGNLACDQYDIA